MLSLLTVLQNYDLELLTVIAHRWDVDLTARDAKRAAEQLAAAMLNSDKVSDLWDRLSDDQRGALQTLLGSAGAKMMNLVFNRLFGEVRPMGAEKMEREKPYLNPANLAEALFYRGFIGFAYGEGSKTNVMWAFVPHDLVPLIPAQRTSYDKLADEMEPLPSAPEPANVRQADTTLVDDLATLLAYCQLHSVALENGQFSAEHQKAIRPYLLGSGSPARLALMITIALAMRVATETVGNFKPMSNNARKWLELPRPDQVKAMAEAWRESQVYNELWFTPGLKAESGRWQNDPLLARQTVLTFLESVPAHDWFSIDSFIETVREEEPDFQRPDGDYESWYIRDAQTGQYLRGFENWDKVDGAVLRFILIGPLHGLGLLDTADGGAACRLSAYGRAFLGVTDYPAPGTEGTSITIQADGVCEVPRTTSRLDRFQLARFAEWGKAVDPFPYRITTGSLAQAATQGISADVILRFLKRAADDQIPSTVLNLIETWGQGKSEAATLSQLTVLRVPTAELMETIQSNPALRRYLGITLGPTAVAVRPGQWHDLAAALEANGVLVEIEQG